MPNSNEIKLQEWRNKYQQLEIESRQVIDGLLKQIEGKNIRLVENEREIERLKNELGIKETE